MKTLKQILFILIAVVGLSLAAMAQGGGEQKPQRPPKEPKPIPARPKPPKDEKPKKPGMSYFVALPPESGYSE